MGTMAARDPTERPTTVAFCLWGPVTAVVGGAPVDLGPARQRCVLAALLTDPGHLVMVDALVSRVWGERPPDRARNVLAGYISRLRAVLETPAVDAILPRATGGYRVNCAPEQVDVHRARLSHRRAKSLANDGALSSAAELLGTAILLCQGTALAGLDGDWVDRTRRQLEDELQAMRLDLADNDLGLGRPAQPSASLREILAAHAAPEPVPRRLMRAPA